MAESVIKARKLCYHIGQIETTDREIDRVVYELYGLSDENTRIVEEATSAS